MAAPHPAPSALEGGPIDAPPPLIPHPNARLKGLTIEEIGATTGK